MDQPLTRIAQVNIHHAKGASALVMKRFARAGQAVVLIQEPWVCKKRVMGLHSKDSKVIWDTREGNPRACILIRKYISCLCITEFMTRDLVPIRASVLLEGAHRDIVLASGYFDAGRESPPPEVQGLVEYCGRLGLPLIIGCDANAHHTVWASTNINLRGENLLEFILKVDLDILNVGSVPTFVTKNRKEVLDLTLGSTSIRHRIKRWRVSNEPSLSDHRIIEFNLDGTIEGSTFSRNPRNTNWDEYRNILKCNVDQLNSRVGSNLEIEESVCALNGAIMDAYASGCPIKEKITNRDVPWWSKKLSKLRAETRRLFNRAKSDGGWQRYTNTLTLYNKEIRRAKRNSFRKFCEGITNIPEAARLHKAMSRGKMQESVSLITPDGSYTEDEEQRALLLLETHFPGSKPTGGVTIEGRSNRTKREDWDVAKRILSPGRLEWAINSFQPYKSPGVDNIYPALLQEGLKEIIPHLIIIMRSSLALGYVPRIWRRARVTFIPKAGKKDIMQAKSYRPISLASFLLKTMEKAVDNYIRMELLETSPLHPQQHAYRAGRSTDTALYELTSTIRETLDCKETAICVFLDIAGAFDNTSHESMIEVLGRRGLDRTTVRWIGNMLSTRIVEAHIGERIIQMSTERGCPQGGVLSPLLWSLVVDELLGILTGGGLHCIGYADDIVIIAKGKFEETLCDLIQGGLNQTKEWCKSVGLSVNPAKTTLVPFTRKRRLPRLRNIQFSGVELEWKSEVKYLGVTLDEKLLWNRHVEEVTKKATTALMTCRSYAGKSWGCNPRILRWMYTMMVRPVITYGSVAWASRTKFENTRKSLEKIQRMACVTITGAMRSCPTAALEVILNLTPLHLVVERLAKETLLRMEKTGMEIRSTHGGVSLPPGIEELLNLPRDSTIRKFNFEKNFSTGLRNKKEWNGESTYPLERHTIRWYTDGSKTNEGTGAGVFGPRTKYTESMGNSPSIFQAEVNAIERCVQFNLSRKYKKRDIAILSDSQAAIRALSSPVISSRMVWNCRQSLNLLGRTNRVSLLWVPGHQGVEGNEEADKLAREGAAKPFTGPEPGCGLEDAFFRRKLKEKEEAERATRWVTLPGCRQAKEMLGNFNHRRSEMLIRLNKNSLRILTGFLTGHCKLKGHLKKMSIVEENNCRFCQDSEETPIHLLTECDAVGHRRAKFLGSHQVRIRDAPLLEPQQLLNFIKGLGLQEVL